jgi:hypothetical protein
MRRTLNRSNAQRSTPTSQHERGRESRALGIGHWELGVVAAALLWSTTAFAQIPNPKPAIDAAKNARAATEAAQKKNSEALDPPAGSGQGVQTPAEKPPQGAPAEPPASGAAAGSGAGYTYEPAGRRDPFVSLLGRGGDVPVPGAARPQGLAGLLINEMTLKGVMKTPKGDFVALLQAPDNKSYIGHAGDKVLDGAIKTITPGEVVFTQDVNDPLSLVKQREVRKAIRPEAR